MIADSVVADKSQLFIYFRIVADTSPMVFLLVLFTLDDIYSGHGEHSEMLRLFTIGNGCFVVSFLICMFQDSVPAGSYNDPFLSSVISMVTPTWCHGPT